MVFLLPAWRAGLFRLACLTLVITVCAATSVSSAEGDRVNELREAGLAAFQAKRYREAKRVFDEAFRLSKLHTLGLWAARSRVELGELIEATTTLNHLTKTSPPPDAPASEKEARQQALHLWNKVRNQIPRLRISVVGVEPADVQVSVDGRAIPATFLQRKKTGPFRRGKSLELNPGKHQIVGIHSSDLRREASVTLEPGQRREIRLKFPNPDTLRQRKCRDECRTQCSGDNSCYVECKRRCFTKKKPKKKAR